MVRSPGRPERSLTWNVPEPSIAIAHQKGVGKTTTTILLAAELAEARPDVRIVVEDQDPDRHLTTMRPVDAGAPSVLDQSGRRTGRALRRIVYPVAP
jgi:cellulose biosynthesis protein BcsQ